MKEQEFKIEHASDVAETYPRLEVTRIGDSFAFLDFSTTEDKRLVVNFWSKDGGVQIPFEFMEELMRLAKDYSENAIANEDQLERGE